MNARRRLPALLLVLALALCCGPAGAADPGSAGRLVFGHLAPCITLDPARAVDVDSIQAVRAMFEGLVRLRDGGLAVEPCLAESWESDPTGRQWTFALRPGVRFHDGAPCDAAAVAFSLQRIMDPNHAYFIGAQGSLPMPLGNVSTVEALDQRRVRFTLSAPHAGFLQGLTLPQLMIVSPAAVAERGEAFARQPVGTGPFVFARWAPDGTVTVRANPAYWGPAPRLAEVVFRPVVNDAQRFHDFAAGSLDVMAGAPPTDAARVARMADATLHALPGLAVSYLAMNTARPPLDRPAVRRAVSHAINTQALVRLIYQGQAEPARGVLPPGVPGFSPDLPGPDYDPALARRLLAEAGLGKGFPVTLYTMSTPRPYLPSPVRTAEAIKGNLEAVGIRVHIVSLDFPSFVEYVTSGKHDMCLLGWVMDTPDPDDFLTASFGGAPGGKDINVSNWRDPRVLDLLGQARQEADPGRRAGLYVRLQDLVREGAPWVPLAHPRMLLAVHSRVRGLVLQPTGDVRFGEAWKQ
jgi:peptide/nickel transport system substrate-binding protein